MKGFIDILKKEKNIEIVPLMGGLAVSSGKISKKFFLLVTKTYKIKI